MSNLLFFTSGLAAGAGGAIERFRTKYDTELHDTTASIIDQVKTAREDRKQKSEKASAKLNELEALGITGAFADMMIRLDDSRYNHQVNRFLQLSEGAPSSDELSRLGMTPSPNYKQMRMQNYGLISDPDKISREPSKEDILNAYLGEFPAAVTRKDEEQEVRSIFFDSLGLGDPTDEARQLAAKRLGIPVSQVDTFLQDDFERKKYHQGVRLEYRRTQEEQLRLDAANMQVQTSAIQLDNAIRKQTYDKGETTEEINVPVLGDDGTMTYFTIPVGTPQWEVDLIKDGAIKDLDIAIKRVNIEKTLEAMGARTLTTSQINILKNVINPGLIGSRYFQGFNWDPRSGLAVEHGVSAMQRQAFALSEINMLAAAQTVMDNPQKFGLQQPKDEIFGTTNYVINQMPTIIGVTYLQLFDKYMQDQDVDLQKLVDTNTFPDVFNDNYFGDIENKVSGFPEDVQTYITSLYQDPTKKNNELNKFIGLTNLSSEAQREVLSILDERRIDDGRENGVPHLTLEGGVIAENFKFGFGPEAAAAAPEAPAAAPVAPPPEAENEIAYLNSIVNRIEEANPDLFKQDKDAILTQLAFLVANTASDYYIPNETIRDNFIFEILAPLQEDRNVTGITPYVLRQLISQQPIDAETGNGLAAPLNAEAARPLNAEAARPMDAEAARPMDAEAEPAAPPPASNISEMDADDREKLARQYAETMGVEYIDPEDRRPAGEEVFRGLALIGQALKGQDMDNPDLLVKLLSVADTRMKQMDSLSTFTGESFENLLRKATREEAITLIRRNIVRKAGTAEVINLNRVSQNALNNIATLLYEEYIVKTDETAIYQDDQSLGLGKRR